MADDREPVIGWKPLNAPIVPRPQEAPPVKNVETGKLETGPVKRWTPLNAPQTRNLDTGQLEQGPVTGWTGLQSKDQYAGLDRHGLLNLLQQKKPQIVGSLTAGMSDEQLRQELRKLEASK